MVIHKWSMHFKTMDKDNLEGGLYSEECDDFELHHCTLYCAVKTKIECEFYFLHNPLVYTCVW